MSENIKMMKLKNGSEEPQPIVLTTMIAIQALWKEGLNGILCLADLHSICVGKGQRVSTQNLEKLKNLALLDSEFRPPTSIRNVVLSAINGEGLSMSIGNPNEV